MNSTLLDLGETLWWLNKRGTSRHGEKWVDTACILKT